MQVSTKLTSRRISRNHKDSSDEAEYAPSRRSSERKLIKLAPFKFPFSKMSKSRSSDGKDREKDTEKDKGKEVDSETEKENNEESDGDSEKEVTKDGNKERDGNEEGGAEDNAKGENVEPRMNRLQLTTETESNSKTPLFDQNSLMVRNEPAIPSSPPPSYEHVIEQARVEHAAEAQKQEEGKNNGSEASGQDRRTKAPKILHKSSKQFYRAMAKQWGITCKMSDHCRCLDCQSRYFDCEYDKNEHQKTDGGLGAGTPMFISEVMEGSGCVLL